MAVICGTPAPVTTRVVQMEPGPMPTLIPSTPARANSHAPSNVATLPAISSISGSLDLITLMASSTREDADQFSIFCDGHAGNFVLAHDFERVGDLCIRRHGDGIDDHAALRALYLVDLVRLLLNAQIAMDDSDPALLSNGDGHMGFSHRIHGGADDRNVQANVARQLGLSVGLCGHHVGVCGQQ